MPKTMEERLLDLELKMILFEATLEALKVAEVAKHPSLIETLNERKIFD